MTLVAAGKVLWKKVLCKGIDFDSVVKNTKSQNQYLQGETFNDTMFSQN